MTKQQIITRTKSLLWRAGMMAIAGGVAYVAEHLAGIGLPPIATAILGLLLGEVSKYLNRNA